MGDGTEERLLIREQGEDQATRTGEPKRIRGRGDWEDSPASWSLWLCLSLEMRREASSSEPVCILQGSGQYRDRKAGADQGPDQGEILSSVEINRKEQRLSRRRAREKPLDGAAAQIARTGRDHRESNLSSERAEATASTSSHLERVSVSQ